MAQKNHVNGPCHNLLIMKLWNSTTFNKWKWANPLPPSPDVEINCHSSPGEFDKLFVTDQLIESILEQALLYNEWRNINSSKREVKESVIKLPNRRMHWSSKTRVDFIASLMLINWLDETVSVLHFNDNNNFPDQNSPLYKKCFKIQHLIDHFREKFSLIVKLETCMSVDEQTAPFKGSHSLKRYLPRKLKKLEYKMWAMAGISGYVYDFKVEGVLGTKGPPNGCDPPDSCGESGFVVLRLSTDLWPGKHQLLFNNCFASPELVDYLGDKKKIWTWSTLHSNRSRGWPIPTEMQIRRSGRSHIEEIVDSKKKVLITAWYDNNLYLCFQII